MSRTPQSPRPGSNREGDFTLVEHPEPGNRGLAVRPVTDKEKKIVRRWGGFLFATEAEAQVVAQAETVFVERAAPLALQTFSHKRVDGLRIYVQHGHGGG